MKRLGVSMVVVALMGATACSDGGGVSTGQFAGKIDDICRSLDRDLADLTQPGSNEELATYASGASKAFEDAYSAMKQLATPSDAGTVKDAKSLLSNLNDQVDTLDAIAKAAKGGDQATIDSKTAEFNKLIGDDADLADSLSAGRCALDPLTAVAPPVTEPPVTEPPVTEPPITDPPTTVAPVTTPPVVNSGKTIIDLASQATPNNGFTFAAADEALASTFQSLCEIAPTSAGVPGKISAIEVFAGGAQPVTRIFIFLPESPLPHTLVDELAGLIAGDSPLSPTTAGGLPGVTYTNTDGVVAFIGSNAADSAGFVVWAVSGSAENLNAGLAAFLQGLQG